MAISPLRVTPNYIPSLCLISAVLLSVFLFSASRNDPSLRIAALVSGTGLVNTLAAIASTMLTGRDVSRTSDLPPGSTQTKTVQLATNTTTELPADPKEVIKET
jgi:hypothetical protein